MSEEIKKSPEVSRRKFIKGTLAVTAGTLMAGSFAG